MKNKNMTSQWRVDALIFGGFLLTFLMDITGVSLHEWLGLAVCVLAVYHLLIHWNWVKAVARGFFGKTSSQSKGYFFLDLLLAAGFLTMLITGLVISTWLNLSLPDFFLWKNIHVIASIGSVCILLIKIGLHWKWVVSATRKVFTRPVVEHTGMISETVSSTGKTMDRREFIKVMAPVTLVTAVAITTAAKAISNSTLNAIANQSVQASILDPQPTIQSAASNAASVATLPTTVPTEAALQATSTPLTSTACVYRCRKGNHCAYPGRCHDYRDSNNNGLCDLGECL